MMAGSGFVGAQCQPTAGRIQQLTNDRKAELACAIAFMPAIVSNCYLQKAIGGQGFDPNGAGGVADALDGLAEKVAEDAGERYPSGRDLECRRFYQHLHALGQTDQRQGFAQQLGDIH